MTNKIIARERQISELQQCLDSKKSELVLLYSRRGCGKTFLVEQFFGKDFAFKFVGQQDEDNTQQLKRFSKTLCKYSGTTQQQFNDWSQAFEALKNYIQSLEGKSKKVLFFDEIPFMDKGQTKEGDFVKAFVDFWTSWSIYRDDILLIAAGSSTSWMIDKLIRPSGALYDHISLQLSSEPYTLFETEQYLKRRRFQWNRQQILECYMVTGGVPYYLSLMSPKLTIEENIDKLCFAEDAPLRNEFESLYHSLFPKSRVHLDIIRILAKHKEGLTRKEISEAISSGRSKLSEALLDLELCDFISMRSQYGNNIRGCIYRLEDLYTLFFFQFIEPNIQEDHPNPTSWTSITLTSKDVSSWKERAFELICYQHRQQIRKALGILGMITYVCNWRQRVNPSSDRKPVQIDMIFQRADRFVQLFQMRYSPEEYYLTPKEEEELRNKVWLFQEATHTRKSVVLTMITPYGLSNPVEYHIVYSQLTLDDLFNH